MPPCGTWRSREHGPTTATGGPALSISGGRNIKIAAVDIRGWSGDGISASGSDIEILDSRIIRCAGVGIAFRNARRVVAESNSALYCRDGFVVDGGRGVVISGCISALNKGAGYRISGDETLINSSNSHSNMHDGIYAEFARNLIIAGNTFAANNQSGEEYAGIRLGQGTTNARVLFNNCGDSQLYATQLVGIREEAGVSGSEIRFNVTATLCVRRGHERIPSLIARGRDNRVEGNWTETLLPTHDSIEVIEYQRSLKDRQE